MVVSFVRAEGSSRGTHPSRTMLHAGDDEQAEIVVRGVIGVRAHVGVHNVTPSDGLVGRNVLVVPADVLNDFPAASHKLGDVWVDGLKRMHAGERCC